MNDHPGLVALAAHGLAGSLLDAPSGPFAADEWFGLVTSCKRHGLIALLAAAAEGDHAKLSDAQAEELAVLESEAAGFALLVEQRVVRLSGLLSAAGTPHRLLGAPARARLGYRQPALRGFESATFLTRDLAQVTPPVGIDAVPVLRDGGVTTSLEKLADPPTLLNLAGVSVPTVSVEEHVVLACLEIADYPSLQAQRDVAELALFPAMDPSRVQETAVHWGVKELVARSLVEVWDLFQLADRSRLSVWARRMTSAPAPGALAAGGRRRRRARRKVWGTT